MYPELIKIGKFTINTYGFMFALGVALGLWFILVQAKKEKLNNSRIIDMAFYTLIVSLLGSKIVLFIGDISYYTKDLKSLWSLVRSGGVFQGGLVFGVLFGLWYVHKHQLPTWKLADIIGPAIALGHGFGRIGCFTAGCCFGKECFLPWGIIFRNERSYELTGIPLNITLHPVQLYEAILNFINFFILFLILKRKKFHGQIICLYIINYSITRFIVEFFRGDHPEKTFHFNLFSLSLHISYPQVFSIISLIVGLFLYKYLRKKKTVYSTA